MRIIYLFHFKQIKGPAGSQGRALLNEAVLEEKLRSEVYDAFLKKNDNTNLHVVKAFVEEKATPTEFDSQSSSYWE